MALKDMVANWFKLMMDIRNHEDITTILGDAANTALSSVTNITEIATNPVGAAIEAGEDVLGVLSEQASNTTATTTTTEPAAAAPTVVNNNGSTS